MVHNKIFGSKIGKFSKFALCCNFDTCQHHPMIFGRHITRTMETSDLEYEGTADLRTRYRKWSFFVKYGHPDDHIYRLWKRVFWHMCSFVCCLRVFWSVKKNLWAWLSLITSILPEHSQTLYRTDNKERQNYHFRNIIQNITTLRWCTKTWSPKKSNTWCKS